MKPTRYTLVGDLDALYDLWGQFLVMAHKLVALHLLFYYTSNNIWNSKEWKCWIDSRHAGFFKNSVVLKDPTRATIFLKSPINLDKDKGITTWNNIDTQILYEK